MAGGGGMAFGHGAVKHYLQQVERCVCGWEVDVRAAFSILQVERAIHDQDGEVFAVSFVEPSCVC